MVLTVEELDKSLAIIDEFVKCGGNAIDTAHCYGPDRHKAVGEYIRSYGRDSLILLDKGCHPYHGRNRVTKTDMESDLLENQERMGIFKTDVFVLHRDDPSVPAGDVITWLNELKSAGRVEAFGASNWHHERIAEANRFAETHGLQGFSLSSPNLALAPPQEPMWAGALALDRAARDWYEATGLPVFAWSSGAHGFFAGVSSDDVKRVYFNDENFARKARAEELAKQKGLSPALVAVAWTLNQPMNVHAIVGPRSVEEVREIVGVVNVKLSPDELRWLETGKTQGGEPGR